MGKTSEPLDLRTTLRTLGLSQSGLARTLVAWRDPRSFNVILRWVQRAAAGDEQIPYVQMILNTLTDHVEARAIKYRSLDMLERGMRTGENLGQGWRDTTAECLAETKRQIRELDALLAECQLDPPVNSPRVQQKADEPCVKP